MSASPDRPGRRKAAIRQIVPCGHLDDFAAVARSGSTVTDLAMAKTSFKQFRIWWGNGDVCVELPVTKSQWEKIGRGQNVTIRGKGYWYEGEWFEDIWHFSGGLDGELEVCYGQPSEGDYSGQGFVGRPRDALQGKLKR
jgi:hypothetical protein